MSECLQERLGGQSAPYDELGTISIVPEVQLVEVSNGHEEAQNPESKQFLRTDELLARKASEFYGKAPYNITDMARLRLFRKAVDLVKQQDQELYAWNRSFDTVKTMRTGEEYKETPISYLDSEGNPGTMRAKDALKQPGVRTMVLESLGSDDPVVHITEFLREWPEKQERKPSDKDIAGAHRAFDLFLFSVRGKHITHEISRLLNPSEVTSTEDNPMS